MEERARFKICQNNQVTVLKTVKGTFNNELVGYETHRKISYWFSYDRSRLVLKYGKGYRMEETTLMKYDFLTDRPESSDGQEVIDPEEVRRYLFSPTTRRVIEQYDAESKQEMIKDYLKRILHAGFRGAALAVLFAGKLTHEQTRKEAEALAESVIGHRG